MFLEGKYVYCKAVYTVFFVVTDFETVLQENEKLKDQKMCKICMDNDVCMMFLPCKHLATCEGCSHIVKECPVCRRSIEERIKVFWA